MKVKEVIEESKTVLQRMNEGCGTKEEMVAKLHKLLGVLAVKAEMVEDADTEEIVAKIDCCRELLEQNAFNDAGKALVFVKTLSEIQCYNWEEVEWELLERECAEADKEYALEDIQKAYDTFIRLKDAYINKYGEYPDIETED